MSIEDFNDIQLDGLERASAFSYSTQYFWWKKGKVINKIFEKMIAGKTELTVLDIGCQVGHDVYRLSDVFAGKNIRWVGLDIEFDFLKVANQRKKFRDYHNFLFLNGNINNLPFNGRQFDFIVCSEVLEHIADTSGVIREIKKYLKTAGVLVISTPNKENSFLSFAKVMDRFLPGIKKSYKKHEKAEKKIRRQIKVFDEEEHVNIKPMDYWKNELNKNDFKIMKVHRGTFFYGAKFLDEHPVIFGINIMMDVLFDVLGIFKKSCYNFFIAAKFNG